MDFLSSRLSSRAFNMDVQQTTVEVADLLHLASRKHPAKVELHKARPAQQKLTAVKNRWEQQLDKRVDFLSRRPQPASVGHRLQRTAGQSGLKWVGLGTVKPSKAVDLVQEATKAVEAAGPGKVVISESNAEAYLGSMHAFLAI